VPRELGIRVQKRLIEEGGHRTILELVLDLLEDFAVKRNEYT
jgi:hypothetical protein